MENRVLQLLTWLLVFSTASLAQNTKRYTAIDGLGLYRIGKVSTATNAWSLAYQACLNEGAHLAIINSKAEADALRTLIVNSGSTSTYFYIGFSDIYDEGHYTTIHGTPLEKLGYSRWLNGIPNNSTTTNCGAVTPSLELSDQGCSNLFEYICEMPLRSDYDYVIDNGYYKFYTNGLTWKAAYKKCEGEGAHLLVVDNEEERDLVDTMLKEHPLLPNTDDSNYIHYGVHDYYKDTLFVKADGGSFVPYVNATWDTSEPKVSTTLNVVRLNRNLKLSVADGVLEYAYICEYEVHPKFY